MSAHKPNGTSSASIEDRAKHDLAKALERQNERGAEILDHVLALFRRFVAYPSEHAAVAHTLWTAHTHAMECWDSTPRLAFLSPEPGSGKSRALEVTELLVPGAVQAVNVSPAYLFRKVGSDAGLTLLYDEIDTVFGPKAKENEELRGFLNAGHRKGSMAGRCVVRNKEVLTEDFPAYCAVAMAGLGSLPDTILTRAVIVRMRRRAPHEKVEPFRRREVEASGLALRDRLAAWAARAWPHGTVKVWPIMPPTIVDRDADVWEALLAVADAAGGRWPVLARDAAAALVKESKDRTPSLGVRLLADLRTVLAGRDCLSSVSILSTLKALEEAPWAELRGTGLTYQGLSKLLEPYEIKPGPIRPDRNGVQVKGYKRTQFLDAWTRYLPPLDNPVTAVTPVTTEASSGPSVTGVTDEATLPVTHAATSEAVVTAVTVVTGLAEGGRALAPDDDEEVTL